MYKIEDFETLTPMKYYDNPEPKNCNARGEKTGNNR